jgi:hypothetical protein
MNIRLAKKNAVENPESLKKVYEDEVSERISKRYRTHSEELAILRKEIYEIEKYLGFKVGTSEFLGFYEHAEATKKDVQNYIDNN